MSFDEDYPAAHSMDTTWFAVDKDGYIACMESDEVGAVPAAFGGDQGNGEDFLTALAQHKGAAIPKDFYGANSEGEFAKSLGLYMYRSGFGFFPPSAPGEDGIDPDEEYQDVVEAYQRQAAPAEPLHVSTLPAVFQDEAKHAMVFDFSFKETEWIQPALLTPCQYWLPEEEAPRAADVDGRLKVIPENLRQESAPKSTYKSQLPKPEKVQEEKPWWKKLFE